MGFMPDVDMPAIEKTAIQPSATYALDFDTGKIKGKIDERQAIEQFIRKSILTNRFAHSIYSDAYGCEICSMIGKGFTDSYLRSEVKRMITDALIYDERIQNVHSFDIRPNGDEIFIGFTADTVAGVISFYEKVNR